MTKSTGRYRKSPDEPKLCSICGQMKEPSEFYGSGFRLAAYCRDCLPKYTLESRQMRKGRESDKAKSTKQRNEKDRLVREKSSRARSRTLRTKRTLEILQGWYDEGLTQEDVAALGISRSQQSSWINGRSKPTENSFRRVREVWRTREDAKLETQMKEEDDWLKQMVTSYRRTGASSKPKQAKATKEG